MEIGLSLEITLIGMAVVFATLLVLMGVVQIPQLIMNLRTKKKEPDLPPEAESQSTDIPPQHLAVIAATVAMLGQSYRVKAIEILGNDNWERSRYTETTTL